MWRGVLRGGIALALLASAAWAAWTLTTLERRIAATDTIGSRLDRLQTTVIELGVAQAGSVMPGDASARWLESVPRLLADTATATAEIGPLLRSAEATQALQQVADATATLAQRDAQVRDSLFIGDAVTAAEIVMGDERAARASMLDALRTLRASEAAVLERDRADAVAQARLMLAGVSAAWVFGLVVLMFIPRAAPSVPQQDAGPAIAASIPPAVPPSVDLHEVADLCMEIARVETSEGIDALLARAARVVDATRVVLWVGAADELVPVMVRSVIEGDESRPMPVRRDADHAAARTWREAAVQLAPGDAESPGEILAPMIGAAGCSGVLAVQFRTAADTHRDIRAAVVLIAAQLSTVVSGIPAAVKG
jgi:hypothetical protein